MGKSRAKWIKNIFAGKKTSKSGLSKEAGEKESFILRGSTEILEEQSPVLSGGLPLSQNRSEENQVLHKGNNADMQKDAVVSLSEDDNIGTNGLSVQNSAEGEKAATKVQATYRGYLARRAFRVLKGIIRLQALVRGHLVRRQAIATLYRMQGIVKLQRMIRGQRDAVMPSRIYIIFRPEKLQKNSFIYKLLISSTSAMPLGLQYDQSEPNSAVMWLRRWSLTQLWAPPPQIKKAHGSGFKKQQNGLHSGETEPSRSKRTRKVPTAENNSNATSDLDKPNRNQRKTSSHKQDSMQEPSQSELERVKRNLRKVSSTSKEVLESSESIPALSKPVAAEPTTQFCDNSDKVLEDSAIVLEKEDVPEILDVQKMTISEDLVPKTDTTPEGPTAGETYGLLNDECPKIGPNPSMHEENGDDNPAVKDEHTPKEESAGKTSHKSKRRMSLPSKQEYPENVSVNTPSPTLPSYMAATESAKAKLKGQGSVKFSQESVENGSIRRHSLPSSNSGRLSSMSPRVQRQVQVNGKGTSKTDRALLASRDSNEKPGWRR